VTDGGAGAFDRSPGAEAAGRIETGNVKRCDVIGTVPPALRLRGGLKQHFVIDHCRERIGSPGAEAAGRIETARASAAPVSLVVPPALRLRGGLKLRSDRRGSTALWFPRR